MLMQWAGIVRETGLAAYIRDDFTAFPLLEVLHVMAIALVIASIFVVDLRLLGLASRDYPVRALMRTMLPLTIVSFTCAALTGGLLFISDASHYLEVTPFLIKMGLLGLAFLNMVLFHLWVRRDIARWDSGGAIPMGARGAGLVSMLLWVAILGAGRFVGFV